MSVKSIVIAASVMAGSALQITTVNADPIPFGAKQFLVEAQIVSRNATPYDPVARAIALGLTPEWVDARFDRALAEAERCPAGAVGDNAPISCLGASGQPLS